MPFARFLSTIRGVAAVITLGVASTACWAQEPPSAPTPQNTPEARPLPVLNYAKPVSHFPNPIGPYTPRHVAPPNLANTARIDGRSEEHTSELQSPCNLVCRLLLEKKKKKKN